jgi:hypothetical protein
MYCRAEPSALTRDAPAIRNSETESCQALRFAFLGVLNGACDGLATSASRYVGLAGYWD